MNDARTAFKKRVQDAIQNPVLQSALDNNTEKRHRGRFQSFASLDEGLEELRGKAHTVRDEVVRNLDIYLQQFVDKVEGRGIQVHRAANAAEAQRLVIAIAQAHDAKTVAKSKSMVSEEVRVNHALEDAGIIVVETDLGEFIVQLRGEPPSHIITPAIHLQREDVAETFERLLGMEYSTDVEVMNDAARHELREVFLTAEVGLSGVNFGVAESGTLCLVTNEGNGRMVTSVPPVHIALMGIERLVPTLEDLDLMLKLLPRSATGQKLSCYVSLMQSPRRSGDPDGPRERHLILVDNGRMSVGESHLADVLLCIRCGACLNACPVFREIGGHAYNSPYPGPIGAVVSPGLFGMEEYGHLAKASSLCGACLEVCPVQIDLPKLLLRVRSDSVKTTTEPGWMRLWMRVYAWVMQRPRVYRASQKGAAFGTGLLAGADGWLSKLPAPFAGWTAARHFPRFAQRTFRDRFDAREKEAGLERKAIFSYSHIMAEKNEGSQRKTHDAQENVARFAAELGELNAVFRRCSAEELVEGVRLAAQQLQVESMLAWEGDGLLTRVREALERDGVVFEAADLPEEEPARGEAIQRLGSAQAGLTGAIAGLANTGSVVLTAGAGRSQLASLLPPIHFVLLRAEDIHYSLGEWLEKGGKQDLRESQAVTLVSGPSRTGDIEMTLTIGVHGPGKLVVFCVE